MKITENFTMSKPKAVKPPPPPDPIATPVTTPEVENNAIKKARKGMSFQKTRLTGNLAPKTGKRTTFG